MKNLVTLIVCEFYLYTHIYDSKLNFDRGFYGHAAIFAARLERGLRIAYSLSIIALSFH